jgi:hypothetical protein
MTVIGAEEGVLARHADAWEAVNHHLTGASAAVGRVVLQKSAFSSLGDEFGGEFQSVSTTMARFLTNGASAAQGGSAALDQIAGDFAATNDNVGSGYNSMSGDIANAGYGAGGGYSGGSSVPDSVLNDLPVTTDMMKAMGDG